MQSTPANDEIIRSGGNGGGGRHCSFLVGGCYAGRSYSGCHEDHIPLMARQVHRHMGGGGETVEADETFIGRVEGAEAKDRLRLQK